MAKESNEQKLQSLLDRLDKTYGKGTLQKLSEKPAFEYDVISSGSIALDAALGIGGFPKGRIIEIFGIESSGKSTVAIHAIAEAQKLGDKAAFIDAEHTFDPNYAEAIGVDVDNLWFNQPSNGEEALEILDAVVQSEQFGVVVVDSVAALVPKAELEGDMGDARMGLQARLMSQAMRKLTAVVSKSNTLVIFINQVREKIGGMGYGPNTVTTGGNALKFYASQRLEVKRVGSEKTGDEVVANKVQVKVIKNKVAPPFKLAEFQISFGVGIDKLLEIIDIATDNNIIKKSGSWFSYGETRLGQGANNVKQILMDNPELLEELEIKVRDLYKN